MDLQNPEERSRFIQTLERLVTNTMIIEREEVKRMTETKTVDWKEALKLGGGQKPVGYAEPPEMPVPAAKDALPICDENGMTRVRYSGFWQRFDGGNNCDVNVIHINTDQGSNVILDNKLSEEVNDITLSFIGSCEFEGFVRAMYKIAVELRLDMSNERSLADYLLISASDDVEEALDKADRLRAEYRAAGKAFRKAQNDLHNDASRLREARDVVAELIEKGVK